MSRPRVAGRQGFPNAPFSYPRANWQPPQQPQPGPVQLLQPHPQPPILITFLEHAAPPPPGDGRPRVRGGTPLDE
ncbi:hypothetical protein [Amycolatopsis cihanbeyliensis]